MSIHLSFYSRMWLDVYLENNTKGQLIGLSIYLSLTISILGDGLLYTMGSNTKDQPIYLYQVVAVICLPGGANLPIHLSLYLLSIVCPVYYSWEKY